MHNCSFNAILSFQNAATEHISLLYIDIFYYYTYLIYFN